MVCQRFMTPSNILRRSRDEIDYRSRTIRRRARGLCPFPHRVSGLSGVWRVRRPDHNQIVQVPAPSREYPCRARFWRRPGPVCRGGRAVCAGVGNAPVCPERACAAAAAARRRGWAANRANRERWGRRSRAPVPTPTLAPGCGTGAGTGARPVAGRKGVGRWQGQGRGWDGCPALTARPAATAGGRQPRWAGVRCGAWSPYPGERPPHFAPRRIGACPYTALRMGGRWDIRECGRGKMAGTRGFEPPT